MDWLLVALTVVFLPIKRYRWIGVTSAVLLLTWFVLAIGAVFGAIYTRG